MSITVDSLELEVQSSAASAGNGIDALSKSLEKLKVATKGGLGLSSVATSLTKINTAANGANTSKLQNLVTSLKKLSECGNLKLSSSVATQIQNIGIASRSLSATDFANLDMLASSLTPLATIGKANLNSFISQLQRLPQAVTALNSVDMSGVKTKVKELAESLSSLSTMGKSNLSSYVSNLKKLPDAVTALNSVDMTGLATKVKELADAFRPLGTEMQKIANGFSAMPTRLQKLIEQTNSLSTANTKAGKSYINFWAKARIAYNAVRTGVTIIGQGITQSNKYIEDLNLFNVSMGEYAEEAHDYAEKVSDLMGIDPAEWMRNQGIFNTITKGFGVASDRAYTMSQNLTQLGYDLSSFFNISYEDAFQKLQSGIAGELEPLRRLGYDLSVARLQQEALNLGITKSVNAMTQAEKSELRYYAIMTQVTSAQGDMARTLEAPANQLRILQAQVTQCARAFGNIFIPVLTKVLPYAIAFVKVLRTIGDVIAKLVGFTLPEMNWDTVGSSIGGVADSADDLSNGLGEAAEKAKEVKNAMLGIDELNVISPAEDTSGSGSDDLGNLGGSLGFDLPTYDFIGESVSSKVNEIVDKMKEWLGITGDINSWSDLFHTKLGKILEVVGVIGAGFLAWKLSKAFLSSLEGLSVAIGVSLVIDSILDVITNGVNWKNEIEGAIGGALIGAGIGHKLGGGTGAAIGVVIGVSVSFLVNGITSILSGHVTPEAVTSAIVGALGTIGGIVTAVKKFNVKVQNPLPELETANNTISDISSGTSPLFEKLKLLAKDLGMGLLIIAEVAAAVGLIALSIWGLGEVLGQIGSAWQPVIDNRKTVLIAMGLGTTTLALVGGATDLLGRGGMKLAKHMGIGIGVLAEIGAATALFVAEIWALGWGLDQVRLAWQPVLDNGSTVGDAISIGTKLLIIVGTATALLGAAATVTGGLLPLAILAGMGMLAEMGLATGEFIAEIWAIGLGLQQVLAAWQPVLASGGATEQAITRGTELLVLIGTATAALGVVTIGTAGALYLAIDMGTAVLVKVGESTQRFIDSLVDVAGKLSNELSPALTDLNSKLPALSEHMQNFTGFMSEFAGQVVTYSENSAIAGIAATIDTIIGWFTTDPLKKMATDVEKTGKQAATLKEKLLVAVPELRSAVSLMKQYVDFIDEIGRLAGDKGTVKLSDGLKVNLKTVGENIVVGFNEGIQNKFPDLQTTITSWGNSVQVWFTTDGGINKETFAGFAENTISGFKSAISRDFDVTKSDMTVWAINLKAWFTRDGGINEETFAEFARSSIQGFSGGIQSHYSESVSAVKTFANAVTSALTDTVSYQVFQDIAKNAVNGFNNGISSLGIAVQSAIWAALPTSTARSYGLDFGRALGAAVADGFRSSRFPTLQGVLNTLPTGEINLQLTAYATGGQVPTGQMFLAREAGPELVGTVGGHTAVMNNDQIVEAVAQGVAGANAEQNELLREEVAILRELLQKDTTVRIGAKSLLDAVDTQRKANGYSFTRA